MIEYKFRPCFFLNLTVFYSSFSLSVGLLFSSFACSLFVGQKSVRFAHLCRDCFCTWSPKRQDPPRKRLTRCNACKKDSDGISELKAKVIKEHKDHKQNESDGQHITVKVCDNREREKKLKNKAKRAKKRQSCTHSVRM